MSLFSRNSIPKPNHVVLLKRRAGKSLKTSHLSYISFAIKIDEKIRAGKCKKSNLRYLKDF